VVHPARFAVCCSFLALAALGFGSALTTRDNDALRAQGEELYGRRCAVCHGPTALGLEEARLAFPESHRRCTQCHKSGGPRRLTYPINDRHMFDVGRAPPLRGPGTLGALRDSAALRAYIQAAMPRHAPGTLSVAEADALATFLEGSAP
jgi:mono/diheme cytochrome c family protein